MGSCCRETCGRGAQRYRGGYICADFYAHQRQRIRAVAPVVCSVEIKHNECRRGYGVGDGEWCGRAMGVRFGA